MDDGFSGYAATCLSQGSVHHGVGVMISTAVACAGACLLVAAVLVPPVAHTHTGGECTSQF